MATNKLICEECGWHGTMATRLTAVNPFCAEDEVSGCPNCFAVSQLVYACEHEDCWREVGCGTPTPNGYAQTCLEHRPVERLP
jgi:hypothetical protein